MVAGRSRHADFSGLSRAISLQPGEQVATTCQNRNWKTKPHSINFQLDRRVSLVKGILVGDDEAAGNDMEPVDEACCEAVAVADEVEALRPLIPSCPPPLHGSAHPPSLSALKPPAHPSYHTEHTCFKQKKSRDCFLPPKKFGGKMNKSDFHHKNKKM